MRVLGRIFRLGLWLLLLGSAGLTMVAAGVWWYLAPRLPSIEVLKDVRLQTPLRVYTRDGALLGEFGEKRRVPLRLAEVPRPMAQAILAAEDDRFYEHPGVDWQGIMRAAWHLLRTGQKGQGGSTITMQVARNFFLGREKTYLRKLNEIILALRIERSLTKDEILELYLNKIYLGHRAYGVGAAAQVYYGAPIADLNLAQIGMIAGLPKAPSRFNPITDPQRALERRGYVLRRMRELEMIDTAAYEEANQAPITASLHGLAVDVEAPYVAEMARAFMVGRFGDEVYTGGYVVHTRVDGEMQSAANSAMRGALLAYSERHGYRGPEGHTDLADADGPERWNELLSSNRAVAGIEPALVTGLGERTATVYRAGLGATEVGWEGLAWARRYIDQDRRGPMPQQASDILRTGDIIRVRLDDGGQWRLTQLPEVEGALVSLDPSDGGILALCGGFDYFRSKFNRATQARRQPGSNFKPFIYSAALEHGFTAASTINDAPVVFNDSGLEAAWRPENYSGKFFGPTRLRVALFKSRNLVSIRLLRAIGVDSAIAFVQRFGFDPTRLPRNLSLALGSGALSPLEIATGYAVFANGGYRVEPYLVDSVLGPGGEEVYRARPWVVCADCDDSPADALATAGVSPGPVPDSELDMTSAPRPAPRVISPQNDYLLVSILRDVIQRGTGRRARVLGRHDLAGKTGTTNEQRDAWFSGFNQQLVATTWVGFDTLRPLGRRETGGHAALPGWIAFMRVALANRPELPLREPRGMVRVRIDPETGLLAGAHFPKAIFETFRVGHAPTRTADAPDGGASGPFAPEGVTEHLF